MKNPNLICLIFIYILSIQCQNLKEPAVKVNCNENMIFKKAFFDKINDVETYMLGKGNRDNFDNALKFLSKYVHVSYDNMLNFTNSYTNLTSFNKDKDNWIKWYDSNRCKNIQFKE